MTNRGRPAKKTVHCRHCRGTLTLDTLRAPHGWLQLTVGVPPEFSSVDDRNYLWIGMFCSTACLSAAMPEVAEQEELARQAYEAEVPARPTGTGGA